MTLTVIGAGGHAHVVVSTALAAGFKSIQIVDGSVARHGKSILGCPIIGDFDLFDPSKGPAVIAIGKNDVRQKVAKSFPQAEWATLIYHFTWIDPSVRIGEGTVVFAGVVIQPEAVIGHHCIINTGSSVDHECVLNDFAQVAPGARLGGNVKMGEGAFVGIGASVHQGACMGAWATLGGGGFLKGSLDAGLTAVGVPARPRE
ncbi:MAG: NeuD/PglB/VioB family sugar acetyltransferase [bacterium]